MHIVYWSYFAKCHIFPFTGIPLNILLTVFMQLKHFKDDFAKECRHIVSVMYRSCKESLVSKVCLKYMISNLSQNASADFFMSHVGNWLPANNRIAVIIPSSGFMFFGSK